MAVSQLFPLCFLIFPPSLSLLCLCQSLSVSVLLWCHHSNHSLILLAPGSLLIKHTCCPSAHQSGGILPLAQHWFHHSSLDHSSMFQPLWITTHLSVFLLIHLLPATSQLLHYPCQPCLHLNNAAHTGSLPLHLYSPVS